jgi:hypothetical protein
MILREPTEAEGFRLGEINIKSECLHDRPKHSKYSYKKEQITELYS